jgi:hypothetical protein
MAKDKPEPMDPEIFRDMVAIRIDCLRIAVQDPVVAGSEYHLMDRVNMFYKVVVTMPEMGVEEEAAAKM